MRLLVPTICLLAVPFVSGCHHHHHHHAVVTPPPCDCDCDDHGHKRPKHPDHGHHYGQDLDDDKAAPTGLG